MHSFRADGWFSNPHGKLMANIKDNPYLPELWTPSLLRGQVVSIDGKQYRVRAEEIFMIHCDERHPYKLPFALMVEEV